MYSIPITEKNRKYHSFILFVSSICIIFFSFDSAIFTNFGAYILQVEELTFTFGIGVLIGSLLIFFKFFQYIFSTGEIKLAEKDFKLFLSGENSDINNRFYIIKKENNKITFKQSYFYAKKIFLFTLILELYIMILIGPTLIIIFQNIVHSNWSFFVNAFNPDIIFGFPMVFFVDFVSLMVLIVVFLFQLIALNGLLFKNSKEIDLESQIIMISHLSRINIKFLNNKNKILTIPLGNLNTLENSFDEMTAFSTEKEKKLGYLSISSTGWEGNEKFFKTLSIKGGSRVKLLFSYYKNFNNQFKNYLLNLASS